MAKVKSAFFCQNCGAQSPKWVGKCPSCGEWNTYVEEVIQSETKTTNAFSVAAEKPTLISDVENNIAPRIAMPGKELSRVLGGGLVPGSLTLFGGEPGIGKSTLLLQIA